MSGPTDEEILAVLGKHKGSIMPTYVVANWVREDCQPRPTAFVLRRLKALEKAGKVERQPSSYATQICWRLAHPTTSQQNKEPAHGE